ncbi:MAG: ABC-F family ATP-binding cassette domain-containing protein [Caldilineaceae bacterium]|nr:ABC-F family ATP-binding cassette domain-containing protein [Caldilineaceae bacterium]
MIAIHLDQVSVTYIAKPIFQQLSWEIHDDRCVGLVGPNGAGKSTFLNILAGKLEADGGVIEWGDTVQLGYYDQESEDLEGRKRLIEFIEEEASLIRTKDGDRIEAAQMLEWFLFPRSMQYGRIDSLSGGERRRLYLLRTLVHRPNVLLLDEPTNDLDIQTLAVLEEFLDNFGGCLIVISHDRYFLDRTVDYILPFEDGKLGKRYPTPYVTYRRLREEEAAAAASAAKIETKTTSNGQSTRVREERRRLTWNEKRELEQLEGQIEQWEAQRLALHDDLNAAGEDYERIQKLAQQIQTLDMSLETAMERWAELAALAE